MKSTNFKLNTPPKKKSHKKLLIIVLVLVLVIGAGATALLVRRNNTNKKAAEEKAQSEAQTDSAKKDVENSKSSNSSSEAAAAAKTTDQVPTSASYSVAIGSFSQANHIVSATANITGASTGYCIFTYSNPDDKPVVSERVSVNGGSCSWSKSEVEFSKLGAWNLNVTYYINDTKAEANKNVTIN